MLTKVRIIKSIIFPVVMHRCKGWAIKKVDHQRIDFVLWYWRRFLRAPWTTRRSNQPILKGINPEYSLEGRCSSLLSWLNPVKNMLANAADTRDVGLIPGPGRSSREGNDNPLQYSCLENPMDRGAWWVTVHGVAKSWTQLSNWTALNWVGYFLPPPQYASGKTSVS